MNYQDTKSKSTNKEEWVSLFYQNSGMTDNKTLKQQFRSSIRRGTGEAHLILQRHPAIDFSAEIIKAALCNYAYDAQSEGSRALYLAELMARSQHQDKIRKAILTGLAAEENDTWA